ncbi:MAG TPA: DinB family protein [Anaerolineales bacterium]|nr:DinB family protein [Anaerolineales bacterium]
MEKSVNALIKKMEHSRALLNTALEKIAPQTEIYPSWKMKQVLDHIAGWDQLVASSLRAYQNGDTPVNKVRSIDIYNATSVTARQDLSLEQSRQGYDAARQEVLEILRSLPEEMLRRRYQAPWGGNCTVSSVVKIFVSHEQEHARQIEEILAGNLNLR